MSRSKQILLFVLINAAMILLAVTSSYRGILLPQMRHDFLLSSSGASLLFTSAQLASLVFSHRAGKFAQERGQMRLLLTGCLLIAFFSALAATAWSYTILLMAFAGIAAGMAFVNLSLNTMIAWILLASQSLMMNLLHFTYGLGTVISQKTVTALLSFGVSWRSLYVGLALLFLVTGLAFHSAHPAEGPAKPKTTEVSVATSHEHATLLAFCSYRASEFIVTSWFMSLLIESYAMNAAHAAKYTTLFFMTFTLGRLFGGFICLPFKAPLQLASLAAGSTLLMALSFLFPNHTPLLIGLTGIFYSIQFPTLLAFINESHGPSASRIMSQANTFGAATVFIVNLVFGLISDHLGIHTAFLLMPIFSGISIVAYLNADQNADSLRPISPTHSHG